VQILIELKTQGIKRRMLADLNRDVKGQCNQPLSSQCGIWCKNNRGATTLHLAANRDDIEVQHYYSIYIASAI